MRHGLVIGKFYPPHEGHHKLIDTALAECVQVTVAVCYSDVENIDVKKRIAWIKDAHKGQLGLRVIPVHDNTPVQYTDETWGYFLDALDAALENALRKHGLSSMFHPFPDTIYSGEAYAPEFAERLMEYWGQPYWCSPPYPKHIEVRMLDRSELTISASLIRANPAAYWEYLRPATRAGLAKRVVICGAESSGTSTLARMLRDHYKTVMVPEYGRYFDLGVGPHHEWTTDDFVHIARKQKGWEDDFARHTSGGLLICDTDTFATEMFHQAYLGEPAPPSVSRLDRDDPADLYLITDHRGVPAENDGTRTHLDERAWMTNWFVHNLPEPSYIVHGSIFDRRDQAVELIDGVLSQPWGIEEPIEYREDYHYDPDDDE